MFTTMENRKRPRLELITSSNNSHGNNSNETIQGVASTTTAMGTATLATIGGQSYILSNGSSSTLPANILLSICDDNSDESEEYIIDSPMLTHIKQENTVATQTSNNQTSHQLPALVSSSSLPQYRIVNQAGKCLNNSATVVNSNAAVTANNTSSSSSSSTLLSNSVHLPAGCEIYVIKEVIDNPKQIIENGSVITNKGLNNSNTTIKLEPMSPLPILRNSNINNTSTTTTLNCNTSQYLINNNNSQITISTSPTTPLITSSTASSSAAAAASSPQDETTKRSLILEAYKKRDDKRRATHNEVERRRRDKINSWIFKLKEMLPTDVTPSNGSLVLNKNATTVAINQNTSTTQLQQQQQRLLVQQQATTTSTRAPPSDSKSQILIKACEYIKSMQEEIKSLRECLTENENLRLCNQRLQDEINTLRSKQQHKQELNNNNNNILITTTTTTNNINNSINNNNNHNNNSNDINDHDVDEDDDCEITLNTLNATYANVQLFAPVTTQHQQQQNNNNHQHQHHLAGLVGFTTNSNTTSSSSSGPATVNVTYAKRELIITDYVD